MRVAVFGAWHLGAVYAAVFAEHGHEVILFDADQKIVDGLRAGRPAVNEPGLVELVTRLAIPCAGPVSIILPALSVWRQGDAWGLTGPPFDAVVLAVDTPVDDDDRLLLDPVEAAARAAGEALSGRDPTLPRPLLVVMSQVPVGTTERLAHIVSDAAGGLKLDVACAPENLRLGRALEDARTPDRMVFGLEPGGLPMPASLAALFAGIHAKQGVYLVGIRDAEMAKHATNAYLATCIAFAGELADACEEVGADAHAVVRCLLADTRVSPKAPLRPGLGFAGGTIARDVQTLRAIRWRSRAAQERHRTPLFDAVLEVDRGRLWRLYARVRSVLVGDGKSLAGKRVAIIGLAYKPGTDTLRRSAAIQLAGTLASAGAQVSAADPKVKYVATGFPVADFHTDPVEACDGSDLTILMPAAAGYSTLGDQPETVITSHWLKKAHRGRDGVTHLFDAVGLLDSRAKLEGVRVMRVGVQS